MKAVILAGGLGTRLSEETSIKPKPMVEIGDMPILWHIMKIYSYHGIQEFIICCGYKGYAIKEFFANYVVKSSSVTFDMPSNTMEVHEAVTEPWKVTLVDTGTNSLTGGRLKRVRDYIGNETFCLTYGDGVGDVDISAVIDFHKKEGLLATLTATQPPGRFGAIVLADKETRVDSFHEKPSGDGAWINGGFFVLEPETIDYIEGDLTTWEEEPLRNLASDGQLNAYKHFGFWQPMDTLRDKKLLDDLWDAGKAPWKCW
jgi:glucose-1-phosphate cytidylyltransferase